MYFCTEQGLWILCPVTYAEITLGRDLLKACMNKNNDSSEQTYFNAHLGTRLLF